MTSKNQTPKDISKSIANFQDSHELDLPTVSQDNPSKKISEDKSQENTFSKKDLKEFKHIVHTFIKSTSPEVNVSNLKNNVGYNAKLSKKEVSYTDHPEDTLKDPTTYIFNLDTLKLTNKTTQQPENSFTSTFLHHIKDVFDDIQHNRAKVKGELG
jgi:hypothetical protein